MLGRQFAALGEAAAGEDVAVGRSHVAFVRTVLSYAVEDSVFSASARRKRAAGHLRQVEKRHAHDPHPGVTGQLEYDHPVSYEVAVAKKPQMILNSEVMGDEQPVPP